MYGWAGTPAFHAWRTRDPLDLILHISTRARLDRCCSAFGSETADSTDYWSRLKREASSRLAA